MPEALYIPIFLVLIASIGLLLYRISRGPTAPDRVLAFNFIGVIVVCFTALMSIKTGQDWYMNIGIAWALLSFVASIALAKHIQGKGFDE